MPSESAAVPPDTYKKSDEISQTFADVHLMQKHQLLIRLLMLFAPVTKIFWEKSFLIKSKVFVINERELLTVLIVPLA